MRGEPFAQKALEMSTLEGILGGLLEVAIRATEASEGSIILLSKERELLTMGLAGGPKKSMIRMARGPAVRSISSWVATQKEPLLLVGPAEDPRFSGVEREIKDAVCVPLLLNDQVVGVLSVSNRKGAGNFNQEDIEKLTALAKPAAKLIASTLAQLDAEEKGALWERRHLAQEIHDGLIQELTAVFLQLEIYEKLKGRDPEKAEGQLEKIKRQVKASLQGLRRLVFDLRVADVEEATLTHMLERCISEFERSAKVKTTLRVTGQERELSSQVKRNLLAIVEESLANVKRHAGARTVSVHLAYEPEGLELEVKDDGRGFDWRRAIQRAWREKRFGLMGMRERAHILGGMLEIESAPSRGTTIKVRVPLASLEGVVES